MTAPCIQRHAALLLVLALVGGCASGQAKDSDGGGTAFDALGHGTSEGRGPGDGRGEVGPFGGTSCDDQLSCTKDLDVNGSCDHVVKDGYCLIDGVCHDDGETSGDCNTCDTQTSSTSWTARADFCTDDGLSCTQAACVAGACSQELKSGYCLVGGACIKEGDGDPQNDCLVCDTSVSTSALQPSKDGSACSGDALACTDDVCKGGACSHSVSAKHCLIGGKCYESGAIHPSGACSYCKPGASQSSWTSISYQGCCAGGVVWYCNGGAIKSVDCLFNPSCGWDGSLQFYDCGTAGASEPTGAHPKSCL
jgi:hypothetical protein